MTPLFLSRHFIGVFDKRDCMDSNIVRNKTDLSNHVHHWFRIITNHGFQSVLIFATVDFMIGYRAITVWTQVTEYVT